MYNVGKGGCRKFKRYKVTNLYLPTLLKPQTIQKEMPRASKVKDISLIGCSYYYYNWVLLPNQRGGIVSQNIIGLFLFQIARY